MPPYQIEWLEEAKADVRALDRPTVMRIFEGVLRFARTRSGDVKALHGDLAGLLGLRLDHYRVLFALEDDAMRILVFVTVPKPTTEFLPGRAGQFLRAFPTPTC